MNADFEMERLKEIEAAAGRYVHCVMHAGLSPYIKENGRHGGSPWSELLSALRVEGVPGWTKKP